jgi:hypothetical protein
MNRLRRLVTDFPFGRSSGLVQVDRIGQLKTQSQIPFRHMNPLAPAQVGSVEQHDAFGPPADSVILCPNNFCGGFLSPLVFMHDTKHHEKYYQGRYAGCGK